MTINEAIEHCKDIALHCDNKDCAYDHVQLMDWLKELKCLRLVVDKKYLDGIALLKKAWGMDYDYYFEKELKRELTGIFAEPKSVEELCEIYKNAEIYKR